MRRKGFALDKSSREDGKTAYRIERPDKLATRDLSQAGRPEAMPLDHSQEHELASEVALSSQLEPDGSAPSKGARRPAELPAKLAAVAQMDAERLRREWRR